MEFSRATILSLVFLFEGGALFTAVILAKYFEISLLPLAEHPVRDIAVGMVATVLPFLFFLFSISPMADRINSLKSLKKLVVSEIRVMFKECTLNDLAVISLLAGIGEEFLFRGVVQVKYGIVFASVLFGLLHFVSVAYAVITMLMGLYLGYVFQQTAGLAAPVTIHVLYDFAALVYLKYFVKADEQ